MVTNVIRRDAGVTTKPFRGLSAQPRQIPEACVIIHCARRLSRLRTSELLYRIESWPKRQFGPYSHGQQTSDSDQTRLFSSTRTRATAAIVRGQSSGHAAPRAARHPSRDRPHLSRPSGPWPYLVYHLGSGTAVKVHPDAKGNPTSLCRRERPVKAAQNGERVEFSIVAPRAVI
jgi:hypothetical protein